MGRGAGLRRPARGRQQRRVRCRLQPGRRGNRCGHARVPQSRYRRRAGSDLGARPTARGRFGRYRDGSAPAAGRAGALELTGRRAPHQRARLVERSWGARRIGGWAPGDRVRERICAGDPTRVVRVSRPVHRGALHLSRGRRAELAGEALGPPSRPRDLRPTSSTTTSTRGTRRSSTTWSATGSSSC